MKIIGHTTTTDIMDNDVAYTIIELTETDIIGGDPLENTHRYWVPAGADIYDSDNYLEPLDEINFNFDADYHLYRQKFGFLYPAEIIAAREKLELTLPETALVLDLPLKILTRIEQRLQLQSYTQEIALRLLSQPTSLRTLIRQHRALIVARAEANQVDSAVLFAKLDLTE